MRWNDAARGRDGAGGCIIYLALMRRWICGSDPVDPVLLSIWILALALIRGCCFGYASAPRYKYFMSNTYAAGHTAKIVNLIPCEDLQDLN